MPPEPETHWTDGLEDGDLKTTLSTYESQGKFFEAAKIETPKAPEAPNWREGLPEDLKETAGRFTTEEDMVRSVHDLRKREGQVRVPNKDSSDEDRTNYYKAIGVPETSEKYKFPEVPEDQMTDEVKASQGEWGEIFHKHNISQEQADGLTTAVNEIAERIKTAEEETTKKADKDFVSDNITALKSEWKGDDFDKNTNMADAALAAFAKRANVDLDAFKNRISKENKILLDYPELTKIFAAVGREMSEGSLGPVMTGDEKETAEDQLTDLRAKIAEAQSKGESKKANALFKKEQDLIAKMDGNETIVGVAGRAA